MGIHEETICIGTPGFAGFVPSLSTKFGMTFGNATREILRTDPSLKKGEIQQNFAKQVKSKQLENSVVPKEPVIEDIWKKSILATGDDRFSFPPVPGYTGYIPRSRDHFGRAFVETTNASLLEFKRMLKSKHTLPPKVVAIQKAHQEGLKKQSNSKPKQVHFDTLDPYVGACNEERSPYRLPKDDPNKTFISGYTGFVPRLQNHFGEPYSHSVRRAIDEFGEPPKPFHVSHEKQIVSTKPIPGFTGFIPGSRMLYSMSFGKSSEAAYNSFNQRDEYGRVTSSLPPVPKKDMTKNKPISGYRGHKPSFK